MTNKEAIEILKNMGKIGPYEQYEAICMAISALDKQEQKKPLTNADRIRAMTDEELARHFSFRWCPPDRHCTALDKITCYDCWFDWLKQEVKDNA